MKNKNILYIFGNNSFLIEREKTGMIGIFREKYGNESVELCHLDNSNDYKKFADNILSVSLFQEKRLFVFFGGREKKIAKKDAKNEKPTFDFFLENIAKNISENDFLIFYNLGAWEENLKKWLEKNATPREQKLSFLGKDWEKYTSLSSPVLQNILTKYAQAEKMRDRGQENLFLGHAIYQSLSHLAILEQENIKITPEIIENFTHNYEGAKMFNCVDAILMGNISQAHNMLIKIQESLDYGSMEIFMWWFIGALRKNVYILHLREKWLTKNKIMEELSDIKGFMIDKAFESRVSAKKLWKFLQKIIEANIAYKSGKWMKKNILWRFFEIDTALLELKK